MFNAYEFMYAGESSYQYGLMLYDFGNNGQSNVSFGNTGSIVETRLNNKVQPIHFGVNYNSKPLEFKLVFGSDHALDRYELENISMWLTGYQDYQWLSIEQPDLERVQFRCLITSLTPISHGWLPVAFEANVRCDCPYAYGYPFAYTYMVKGDTEVVFRNESSTREPLKPVIIFRAASGTTSLSITNINDNGREFALASIPGGGTHVKVDNANGIIEDLTSGSNLYDGFNLNFFRLVHGDNVLKIVGDGELTISGRFIYNVAG